MGIEQHVRAIVEALVHIDTTCLPNWIPTHPPPEPRRVVAVSPVPEAGGGVEPLGGKAEGIGIYVSAGGLDELAVGGVLVMRGGGGVNRGAGGVVGEELADVAVAVVEVPVTQGVAYGLGGFDGEEAANSAGTVDAGGRTVRGTARAEARGSLARQPRQI